MKENRSVEWKEKYTRTFLKTVSAYANYGTGIILFGVKDNGVNIGVENTKELCQAIENSINDSIRPVPKYTLEVMKKKSVVKLTVFEGPYKPYLYNSKAYRRNDTATVEVDINDLKQLIMDGESRTFEEMPSSAEDLRFELLKDRLIEAKHLAMFTLDTLKTLELYSDDTKYNKAAELVADNNRFNGLDMARFGESINIIRDREILEGVSALKLFDAGLVMFKKYYEYEEIKGSNRITHCLIPEEAFRESLANAIVHRRWDIDANITVSMFDDKIEIVSPGGLPRGVSKEEYIRGGLSVLRNRILGNIFFQLGLIEKFGTGIRRIVEQYENSTVKPIFNISGNAIQIILPVYKEKTDLKRDAQIVYDLIKGNYKSSSEVAKETGFGKSKATKILKELVAMGYANTIGNGRGLKYGR